ncbi:hypothetical protein SHKM778_66230 [Streptomyces sp. KM77-8]|uniref:Uncharacterized protein n=1 Tax=Streptomyces haneummycinicus TaxID=3074435 RepID=A0AAT9HT70_9ACTN
MLDAARRLVPVDPAKGLDSGEAWLKGEGAMLAAAERVVEAAGFRRETALRLLEQTRATAAECLVDPEDDLGMGSVHFPEPHLVGAGRRTAQRTLASARRPAWCCAVTRGAGSTGSGCTASWTSSPTTASPPTSSPSPRSSTTYGTWASGSPRAAPAPARWSTTSSASRTPIRSSTGC